ncbi:MAG: 6-hydroxymethylpterin diphosphokinase MptE-like protein [Spirochaetia bacterium]
MNNASPLLTPVGRGFSIFYRGKSLYSGSTPVETAEKRAESAELEEQTLYILPSPLLCYGIDKLLARLPESSNIICIEADQELMKLTFGQLTDKLKQDPRISFVRTEYSHTLLSFISEFPLHRFRRVKSIRLNGGYRIFPELYRDMEKQLTKYLGNYWKNRITTIHMGRLWIKNILLNVPQLSHTQKYTAMHVRGNILVIGAGTSLNTVLPIIRQFRSRVFCIAVDTALPALLSASITPDAVVIVESQSINLLDFTGTAGSRYIPILDLTSHPQSFRIDTAMKKQVFFSNFTKINLFSLMQEYGLEIPSIPAFGSVGNIAFFLASRISEGRIFFTGLDFAAVPGETHAKSSLFHVYSLTNCSRYNKYPLYNLGFNSLNKPASSSGLLKTSPLMEMYADTLESLIPQNREVFDLRPWGLKIIDNRITEDDFSQLLADSAAYTVEHTAHEIDTSGAEKLISDLHGEIGKFIDLLNCNLNAGEYSIKGDMKSYLQYFDFIYAHFPDSQKAETPDRSFLKRLLISACYYEKVLKHAKTLF